MKRENHKKRNKILVVTVIAIGIFIVMNYTILPFGTCYTLSLGAMEGYVERMIENTIFENEVDMVLDPPKEDVFWMAYGMCIDTYPNLPDNIELKISDN